MDNLIARFVLLLSISVLAISCLFVGKGIATGITYYFNIPINVLIILVLVNLGEWE